MIETAVMYSSKTKALVAQPGRSDKLRRLTKRTYNRNVPIPPQTINVQALLVGSAMGVPNILIFLFFIQYCLI